MAYFDSIVVSETPYNPQTDVSPVDQFGFVDLHDAFINASIPGDLVVDTEKYNGVDQPASLIGRPSDVFDAIRRAEYVQSMTAAAAEASAATSDGGNE